MQRTTEQEVSQFFSSDYAQFVLAVMTVDRPYKQVVTVKLVNNYTNNELSDPHGFKEQVKIKYDATTAIAGKFPNGTAALMELLSKS